MSSANELLMLVDTINATRRERVVHMVQQAVGALPADGDLPTKSHLDGRRVAIWGAAFSRAPMTSATHRA